MSCAAGSSRDACDHPRLRTNVANPELGTKRICAGCNVKFYDLRKDPIVCPACAAVFVVPKQPPARPRRVYDAPPAPARVVAEAPDIPLDKEDGADLAAAGVPMLEEMDEDDTISPASPA
jgi:uncharacterized protein (TIGR02300 family)